MGIFFNRKRQQRFNGNPETIQTGTLAIPSHDNYFFNSSANIAPAYNVNPKSYKDGGLILSPLNYTGQSGPADYHDRTPMAGALVTAPGPLGFATLAASVHVIAIDGRTPGG